MRLAENFAKTVNNRFYYGWIIAVMASLGVFFSAPGQTFFISGFIDLYIEDFGWNRATISSLYSGATLLSGFLLFLIGRFADKFGQKRIIIIVAVVLGLVCLWNSFIVSLWMLAAGFFVCRITGQGSMVLLPSIIVPRWFIKRRALALSIMSIGGVVASAVIPPFNTWLVDIWGWNNVWKLWGLLLVTIFVPLMLFFLFNKPDDLGLMPDNSSVNKKENSSIETEIILESWTLKEALHTRSFWGTLYCQALIPMINTGLVFHFFSILGSKSYDSSTVAFILSILALVTFPSTLLSGILLDRIKIHYAFIIISAMQLSSLAILLFFSSFATVIAFAVIQGMAIGLNSVANGVVWPHYYGMNNLGSIRGLAMTTTVIASAIGPIPFGVVFDRIGSYENALIIMMFFPLIGIFAGFISTKPKRKNAV